MNISEKKKMELYKAFSDPILDARIQIARMGPGNKILEQVDEKLGNNILDAQKEFRMKKQWRVGWKPIDRATANPQWSGVIFDSFLEASSAAASLNKSDLGNHYFPDLMPEKRPERCTDCGHTFETDLLKPPPDPAEKGRLCPSCYENALGAFKANGSLHCAPSI
jgi:hypothetical protein